MSNERQRIAIVGLSSLFARSEDVAGFWRDVIEARDRISDVPPTHWLIEDYYDADPSAPDKTYCKRGGFLNPIPFDPLEFGIPPNALPSTDSAQLLALVAAKRVLADAARTRVTAVDPDRISVILGVASTTELVVSMGSRLQAPIWRKALREAGLPEAEVADICKRIAAEYTPWVESSFPGLLGNVVAGRVTNRLDLGGMNCVIDAACASSLAAVELGIKELEGGDSDMVVTGGVDALNDIMMYMCFSKTPAFSLTNDCRPFSDRADGTIIGEGVGLLALRRLEDAERDGDAIYAVITGLGASSDGRASSVYAPRPEGQAKALLRAYAKAAYAPSTVELVEAHGTGTIAGDAAEFRGLTAVFGGEAEKRTQWCALGSVKSQIGHTKAAAGSAGLIKAALALNEKVLPPTLKVDRPNPALNIGESPFYLNTSTRPWVRSKDHPRRASVSSFGFGGSNFHVALEEYTGPGTKAPRLRALPEELVVLGAGSRGELASKADALATSGEGLARNAFISAQSFDANAPVRLAIVAATEDELKAKARAAAEALRSNSEQVLRDPDIAFGFGAPAAGQLAFLFPGQGSHYVGMGAAAAIAFDAARAPWDEAADLAIFASAPLHDVAFPHAAFTQEEREVQRERLTEMANAQPAIAAVSRGLENLLAILGVTPEAVAGHSFGEVAALSAAGVIDSKDLLRVARRRGELMTEAARNSKGAMLACAADGKTIKRILNGKGRNLVIANDNAPEQVVLAGSAIEIGEAEGALKAAGMTGYRLPVATAFHSPFVAPSVAPFHDYLAALRLSPARVPVYSNTTSEPYPPGADAIARQLSNQLASPVAFRGMIERMYADGIRTFVEVGPGRVLTGLVGQCLGANAHLAVALDDRKGTGLRALWRGLGQLAAAGVRLDLPALFKNHVVPAAKKPIPAHAVMISGANFGKPYPPKGGAKSLPAPNPERPPAAIVTPPVTAPVAPPAQATWDAPALRNAPSPDGHVPSPPLSIDPAELTPIERIHRETFAAHRQYQELMAESHRAFLDVAARAIAEVGGSGVVIAPTVAPTYSVAPAMPQTLPPITQVPEHMASVPASVQKQISQPSPPLNETVLAPSPPHAARSSAAPSQTTLDPTHVVLDVVAEKTGYPADMLGLDLEMEAGLGIDSIKQVEILSALQDRLPGLPEIAPAELSRLKTLRDVIGRLQSTLPVSSAAPVVASVPSAPAVAPAPGPTVEDPAALVLAIVAEKTGYPADMLGLDLEMEAGLGIDSIKQVEILSAIQERLPNLPEIAPAELAQLKTLRQVVDRVSGGQRARHPAVAAAEAAIAAAPALSVAPLLLSAPSLVASPAAGFDMTRRRVGEIVYVTEEVPALAAEIVRLLRQRGVASEVCVRAPEGASAAVSLAALGPGGASAALSNHLAAFSAARSVAQHANVSERLLVTVQSTAGFGLAGDPGAAAWNAGVCGIVKTAAREWPGAACKAIDVADGANAAAFVVGELCDGGPELEVAFSATGVRSAVFGSLETVAPTVGLPLDKGAVLVVSGGARGVTARCVQELAASGGYRLALLGRTELQSAEGELGQSDDPVRLTRLLAARAEARGEVIDLQGLRAKARALAASNEVRAALARLAARGIDAMYVTTDVRSQPALAAAFDKIRTHFGAISGIVHGAGVLADKRIADLTDVQFAEVFATKVDGLAALLGAAERDPIRLIVLFSSIAGRMGNAGQAAYAAANEVLNKVAEHEARARGRGTVVRAYNWGPWDGGMVDASLKAHFARQGAALIPEEGGARFFASDLSSVRPVELVVAAPAPVPALEPKLTLEIDAAASPQLLDHKIRGKIVVPMVFVADRMLALANALRPQRDVRARLKDLRVLAGVTLNEGERVRLEARVAALDTDGIEIVFADEAGRARYRAVADYPEAPPAPLQISSAGFRAWELMPETAYAGPLFHGPRFQALAGFDGISSAGGMARLLTSDRLDWREPSNALDEAMIDGGLQLGLLWCVAERGFPALPQRLGELRILRAARPGEGVRCSFAAKPKSGSRVDFDFVFSAESGETLAEILDAEFFAYEA